MTEILSSKNSKLQSERSIFVRFRLNAFSYGYAQIVTLCAQLVLVPFFLKYWGTELYAEWLVLTGIPSMLTLLDLGVAQASANRASMLAGGNDIFGVRRSLQTALAFTLGLSIAILALVSSVGQLIDWSHLLDLSNIKQEQAGNIILIMSAYLCISLLGGPIDGWFKAIDRTALGAFLLANRRMADIIISIIILMMGGGVLELAAAMLIVQLILMVCLVWVANRLSPWALLGVSQASWIEFRGIFKPAIAYAGFPLAQVVTLQGSLQILNQIATPSTVVGFTMARTMMRLIIQLGVVANNALKPEISRLAGRGKTSEAIDFTLRATVWISIFSGIIYLCGIIAGPWIIDWWGHGVIYVDRINLAAVGIHSLFNVAWFVPSALLIALNKHVSTAGIYGVSSVLALLTWIYTSHLFSPVMGAGILLTLPELVVFLYCIYCLRSELL